MHPALSYFLIVVALGLLTAWFVYRETRPPDE